MLYSSVVKSIGDTLFVHCIEVACISEGPLSEVSLYMMVTMDHYRGWTMFIEPRAVLFLVISLGKVVGMIFTLWNSEERSLV